MTRDPLFTRLLFAGGAAWLAAIFLFAMALQPSARPRRGDAWSITRSRTAHHALIVDVVATEVGDATRIAAEIVHPVRHRYAEALIYIRGPGEDGRPSVRRVQWTPAAGYTALVIE